MKHFHHISSVNVLRPIQDAPEEWLQFDASTTPSLLDSLPGYPQTKLTSELFLTRIFNNLAPKFRSISIFRPATIAFNPFTGASNLRCFTTQSIAGLIQLGGYPSQMPERLLLTEVSFCASVVVQLCDGESKCIHIVNPNPPKWIDITNSIRDFGFDFNCFDNDTWQKKL